MFWASPAIGEDGTVYICTRIDRFDGTGYVATGYLRALGELDSNAPSTPEIDGPKKLRLFKVYKYSFKATSPLGNDVYYWIEWGDMSISEWIGPYASGEEITLSHEWTTGKGAFKIRVKVKDNGNLWGPWGEFEAELLPKNKEMVNLFLLQISKRFPILQNLLTKFISYSN